MFPYSNLAQIRMTEAFSSNCELVLQQSVNVTSERNVHRENLVEVYQIDETCQFINSNLFTKVCYSYHLIVRQYSEMG